MGMVPGIQKIQNFLVYTQIAQLVVQVVLYATLCVLAIVAITYLLKRIRIEARRAEIEEKYAEFADDCCCEDGQQTACCCGHEESKENTEEKTEE